MVFYQFLCNRQIDGGSEQSLTHAQLRSQSIRLAEQLRQTLDIRSGDVVGIFSENRMEFVVTVHATLLLGAIVAPFNVDYSECNELLQA